MADESSEPSADEQRLWTSPQDLLIELSPLVGGSQTAVSEVLARLEAGRLAAYAESASWKEGGKRHDSLTPKVPTQWWSACKHIHPSHADFWRTGTLVVSPPQDSLNYTPRSVEFFDVRFDPEGIARIPAIRTGRAKAPSPAPIPTPPEPPLRPAVRATANDRNGRLKVDPKVLRDWVAGFCPANPDAGFEIVLANARLKFPHLWVTERPVRDAIADLGFAKKRGNPTIRRK